MAKIIIGVHGLGNKPDEILLQKWWKAALTENLNGLYGRGFFRFKLVYWASALYSAPLDVNIADRKSPLYLAERYCKSGSEKEEIGDYSSFKKKLRSHLNEQLDRIFLEDDGRMNFSKISDYILKHFFKDLDFYYNGIRQNEDQPAPRDVIRKHRHKKILLIAHSMGSIIAMDVLNHYIPEIKIDTLVTIGSPLGMPVIRGHMLESSPGFGKDGLQMKTPENIRTAWYNLADFKDKVAFCYKLGKDFLPNSRGVAPQDYLVHNNFRFNGEPNAHKSYGYLRCREMGDIAEKFLKGVF